MENCLPLKKILSHFFFLSRWQPAQKWHRVTIFFILSLGLLSSFIILIRTFPLKKKYRRQFPFLALLYTSGKNSGRLLFPGDVLCVSMESCLNTPSIKAGRSYQKKNIKKSTTKKTKQWTNKQSCILNAMKIEIQFSISFALPREKNWSLHFDCPRWNMSWP